MHSVTLDRGTIRTTSEISCGSNGCLRNIVTNRILYRRSLILKLVVQSGENSSMDMQSRLYRGKTVFNGMQHNRPTVLQRVSTFLQKLHQFEQKSLNSRVTVGWSRHSIDLTVRWLFLPRCFIETDKNSKKSQNSRAIIAWNPVIPVPLHLIWR